MATTTEPKLTIELVPTQLWYVSNVRTILPKEEWDQLRRACYRAARYVCEICGGKGPEWPIEAHEAWHYDDERRVQSLERLLGLCPNCHHVKHFGRSNMMGMGEETLAHFCKVNGFSIDGMEAEAYIVEAFQIWRERSDEPGWKLVVDWDAISQRYGVRLSLHGVVEYPAKGKLYTEQYGGKGPMAIEVLGLDVLRHVRQV